MAATIRITNAVPLAAGFRFLGPVTWGVAPGEQWAVVGPNGAGKSLLATLLQGRIALLAGSVEADGGRDPWEVTQAMEFRDIYSLVDCGELYYQQRWNSTEIDRVPLAGELLAGFPPEQVARHIETFGVGALLEKRVLSLSSGELRKLLIVRTLMAEPEVLVIDNPFIGLDALSRAELDAMLAVLAAHGMQVVLLVSTPRDIPAWITHVQPVRDMGLLPALSREAFFADTALQNSLFGRSGEAAPPLPGTTVSGSKDDYQTVLRMEGVTVRYGDTTILNGIDWEVGRGERWALLGPNGSGKSTLLSLVTGDNPQAYANRVTLFDRRRGTGESIWDIKRRIGMLNPDMHTFYMKDIDPIAVVASGFFDSVGLYNNPTDEQYAAAREWLAALGGAQLEGRSFVRLSFGEQRLVLLARAMVKDPGVLILDEPLHGLDAARRRRARELVDAFCSRPGKTLIYVTHYREEIPSCVTRFKELAARR